MTHPRSILLLAGSAEARQIAKALAASGMDVTALKSEPPRGPNPMPVPYKVIEDVSVEAIQAASIGADAIVDASHGFDGAMTRIGFASAKATGTPFVSYQRAPWDVAEHPKWRAASDVAAAMPLIPAGARVFSATGWASLPDYAAFPGACLMLRQTTRHDRPPPFDIAELVFGDPPFSVEQEIALFEERGVNMLICRNLGGAPSRPKLDAAKALNLDVILIDRPPLPKNVSFLSDVDAILDWVAQL